ncbi:hypothetical protein BH09ACT5_BH09ACT5_05950 [soil metagenome]
MSFEATVIRVMISSPSDVVQAREATERAIHDWNLTNAERSRVVFMPWRWETAAVPSLDGTAQGIINAQGVDQSDLIVALFGSRLGSPSPAAVSGTVEEIERARVQGKTVHLFFSKQPHPADVDPEQLIRLRQFEDEIAPMGLLGSFQTLDDLRHDIERVLTSFVDGITAQRRSDHFEHGLSDRVYEEINVEWSYLPGSKRDSVWDATTVLSRRLTARGRGGVSRFSLSLTRDNDAAPHFGVDGPPVYNLDPSSSRSSPGLLELRPPHKQAGTSFAQDVAFLPGLSDGDQAYLLLRGKLPGYKFAYRDDIAATSSGSKLGLREWDYNAFVIGHPTALLNYAVFLPDVLGAVPLGPRVDRGGVEDVEMTRDVLQNFYAQEREEREGRAGWLMSMSVREPVFKYTYRLMWRPPARPVPAA